jgi:hypothetical protein
MNKSTPSSDEPPVSPATMPKKPGGRVSSLGESEADKLFHALLEYDGFPVADTRVSITPNGTRSLRLGLHSGDRNVFNIYSRPNGDKSDAVLELSTSDLMSTLLAREDLPAEYRAAIEATQQKNSAGDSVPRIQSVFDLCSVFDRPEPIEYLVKPELPKHSVTYLAGESESGKSTLACAWGRDLLQVGHGVLLLDRDRNPRSVILNRLERLGILPSDDFRVWDACQTDDIPQPNDPRVLDWVKRMVEWTGLSPLVIVDSLVSFLLPGEDENSSTNMRALVDRCRAVNRAGGTVLLLHHPNRSGQVRGSSDFVPATDQGFIVSNHPAASHRLNRIELKVDKSRYGLVESIHYDYADGRMVRSTATRPVAAKAQTAAGEHRVKLVELLKQHPGLSTRKFEKLAGANHIRRKETRLFRESGVKSGEIRQETVGSAFRYHRAGKQP